MFVIHCSFNIYIFLCFTYNEILFLNNKPKLNTLNSNDIIHELVVQRF